MNGKNELGLRNLHLLSMLCILLILNGSPIYAAPVNASRSEPAEIKRARVLKKSKKWKQLNKVLDMYLRKRRDQADQLLRKRRIRSAEQIQLELLEQMRMLGRTGRTANVTADLAVIAAMQGDHKKARRLIEQAESRSNYTITELYVPPRAATVVSLSGKKDEAITKIRRALSKATLKQQGRFYKNGRKWRFYTGICIYTFEDATVAKIMERYGAILKRAGESDRSNEVLATLGAYTKKSTVNEKLEKQLFSKLEQLTRLIRDYKQKDLSGKINDVLTLASRFGRESAQQVTTLLMAATASSNRQKYLDARRYQETALAIIEKKLGREHCLYFSQRRTLGTYLEKLKQFSKAENIYRSNLDYWMSVDGSPMSERNNLQPLLYLYKAKEDKVGVIRVRKRIIATYKREEDPHYSWVIDPLEQLARDAFQYGNYSEAEKACQRIYNIQRENNKDKYDIASSAAKLALIEVKLQKYGEAINLYKNAIKLTEEGRSKYMLPEYLSRCSTLLKMTNRHKEAEQMESRARSLRMERYPTPY